MRPVIKRIAECIWQSSSPLLEFLEIRSIASDEAFIYAVSSHGTPLVVVATEPQLGNRCKTVVVGNHFRRQMTVIVDNRQLGCNIVIEMLGG